LLRNDDAGKVQEEHSGLINKIYSDDEPQDASEMSEADVQEMLLSPEIEVMRNDENPAVLSAEDKYHFAEEIQEEETLSLQEKELELIKKSLNKNNGKRKAAADELGISERTLYRKIKQYNL